MILFEAQIQEHQSLAQHYRELAAKRETLAAELLAVQEQADASLLGLKSLLEKCREASPNAIASLKSAVVSLFNDGDNDSGGNQPDSPTPPVSPDSDDSDEPELLCLNGITGDYLLDSDEPDATEPQNLEPLGVLCCDFASPICCLLEDCPESSLTGQHYELCGFLEDAPKPFVELVIHQDNKNVAYIKKVSDGQLMSCYFGFSLKRDAQSWKDFLEAISHRIELRKSKQVPGVTWEIKCWGMNMAQINRLAKNCDFSKPYQPQAPKSESPAVELGVMPPSDWGKPGSVPVLEENDTCEVLMGKFTGQVGTVASISKFSEKPIAVNLPGGHVKHFLRSELKLVSGFE